MLEGRSTKRKHLIYYLRIFNCADNELVGRLLDVTTEGLLLFGENTIETNKIFNLRMALPQEIVTKKDILLTARSLHCKKDTVPGFYNTGFKIEHMEEGDRLTLIRIMNRYSFQN